MTVDIVTEWISDHNDTNQRNNRLNDSEALNITSCQPWFNFVEKLYNWLIALSYQAIKVLVKWNEECRQTAKCCEVLLSYDLYLLSFKK